MGKDKKKLVQLHVDRWKAWEYFFKSMGWKELKDKREPRKESKAEFENAVVAEGVTWAVRIFRRGDDFVEFDAGFGSMNEASDLDVNVVSTTHEVLDAWMEYTYKQVEETPAMGAFCEYWDSNFYYAPGFVIEGKKERKIFGYVDYLTEDGFRWTTPDTALYELQCVDAYTRAYEEGSDIIVGDHRSRPNPEGINRDKEHNIYHANLEMGEKFRTACENYLIGGSADAADAVRYAYLRFAVCKVEGLICVTSLAICKVLGDKFFVEYVNKPEWFKPYMAGISAYEMLRNLQMHVHNGKYKSKYAKRLIWVLMNNEGLCNSHNRRNPLRLAQADKWEDPAASIIKDNTSSVHDISKAIGFLLDFMDGIDVYGEDGKGTCKFMDSSKWESNLGETLDNLCKKAKAYVEGLIKEKTSDKQSGVEYVKKLVKS